jgi:hypothetical protein
MPSRFHIDNRIAIILLLCGVLPALGGCGETKVRAAAPAPAPAEAMRPMTIAPDTDATPPSEVATTVAPTIPAATTPASPPVILPTAKPAAPHKPVTEPSTADNEAPASHPPVPLITPQLSAGDQANYQRKTTDDLAIAESNLQQTDGKQLNATQTDLTGKIRSFVAQSRDASKEGDWSRAQNLAQKARLLSIELINSL